MTTTWLVDAIVFVSVILCRRRIVAALVRWHKFRDKSEAWFPVGDISILNSLFKSKQSKQEIYPVKL